MTPQSLKCVNAPVAIATLPVRSGMSSTPQEEDGGKDCCKMQTMLPIKKRVGGCYKSEAGQSESYRLLLGRAL